MGSVACTQDEFALVQQTLQVFPQLRGAVVYDAGKARYCLDLGDLAMDDAKKLIEQVQNTVDFALLQFRVGR